MSIYDNCGKYDSLGVSDSGSGWDETFYMVTGMPPFCLGAPVWMKYMFSVNQTWCGPNSSPQSRTLFTRTRICRYPSDDLAPLDTINDVCGKYLLDPEGHLDLAP